MKTGFLQSSHCKHPKTHKRRESRRLRANLAAAEHSNSNAVLWAAAAAPGQQF
jgi:hypothetical protein